jgi:AcrR family transcriptional regulator
MLNVRSVPGDDLTTKARIRDAAIRRFGADGYERTSIRAIARDAGVSPALVMHHFGSKEALRTACTRVLLDEYLGRQESLTTPRAAETIRGWLADLERFRPLVDYLSRLLVEDSPAADEVFDMLLDSTRAMFRQQREAGLLAPNSDPEALAVMVTLFGVAPLLAQRQLARALGVGDVLSTEAMRRLTIPVLELYTHGVYADDRFLRMAQDALDRTAPADRSPDEERGASTP